MTCCLAEIIIAVIVVVISVLFINKSFMLGICGLLLVIFYLYIFRYNGLMAIGYIYFLLIILNLLLNIFSVIC